MHYQWAGPCNRAAAPVVGGQLQVLAQPEPPRPAAHSPPPPLLPKTKMNSSLPAAVRPAPHGPAGAAAGRHLCLPLCRRHRPDGQPRRGRGRAADVPVPAAAAGACGGCQPALPPEATAANARAHIAATLHGQEGRPGRHLQLPPPVSAPGGMQGVELPSQQEADGAEGRTSVRTWALRMPARVVSSLPLAGSATACGALAELRAVCSRR